jgi:bifunctional non-homologous end joining protein LigD
MLATRGTHVPTGEEWVHEVKWDGMRVLADVRDGGLRLTSRNENDVTVSFPELHALPGDDLLLDAEVVAFQDGIPTFGALQERIHIGTPKRAAALAERNPVTLLAFDLLRLDGRDLTREPLDVRRDLLTGLGLDEAAWQVPPVYDDGSMLFQATLDQGLEGMVSKRRSSRYEFGARSPHWLKFPHRRRTSWVVGGWRPETGSATRLGAVLVGEPTSEGLVYRGRVGSGIAGKVGPMLLEALATYARDTSPFVDEVPRVDAVGTRWVEPVLVVDVESLGLSRQQRLRQPSYRGVRPDLNPEDLT